MASSEIAGHTQHLLSPNPPPFEASSSTTTETTTMAAEAEKSGGGGAAINRSHSTSSASRPNKRQNSGQLNQNEYSLHQHLQPRNNTAKMLANRLSLEDRAKSADLLQTGSASNTNTITSSSSTTAMMTTNMNNMISMSSTFSTNSNSTTRRKHSANSLFVQPGSMKGSTNTFTSEEMVFSAEEMPGVRIRIGDEDVDSDYDYHDEGDEVNDSSDYVDESYNASYNNSYNGSSASLIPLALSGRKDSILVAHERNDPLGGLAAPLDNEGLIRKDSITVHLKRIVNTGGYGENGREKAETVQADGGKLLGDEESSSFEHRKDSIMVHHERIDPLSKHAHEILDKHKSIPTTNYRRKDSIMVYHERKDPLSKQSHQILDMNVRSPTKRKDSIMVYNERIDPLAKHAHEILGKRAGSFSNSRRKDSILVHHAKVGHNHIDDNDREDVEEDEEGEEEEEVEEKESEQVMMMAVQRTLQQFQEHPTSASADNHDDDDMDGDNGDNGDNMDYTDNVPIRFQDSFEATVPPTRNNTRRWSSGGKSSKGTFDVAIGGDADGHMQTPPVPVPTAHPDPEWLMRRRNSSNGATIPPVPTTQQPTRGSVSFSGNAIEISTAKATGVAGINRSVSFHSDDSLKKMSATEDNDDEIEEAVAYQHQQNGITRPVLFHSDGHSVTPVVKMEAVMDVNDDEDGIPQTSDGKRRSVSFHNEDDKIEDSWVTMAATEEEKVRVAFNDSGPSLAKDQEKPQRQRGISFSDTNTITGSSSSNNNRNTNTSSEKTNAATSKPREGRSHSVSFHARDEKSGSYQEAVDAGEDGQTGES